MPQLDLNTFPYFDDFNEVNKYYNILFSPKIAVQTRELNQLQSTLYNQQQRHADHIFKQGAIVKGGEVALEVDYNFIKVVAVDGSLLESTTYRDTNFLNKIIRGTSGIRAVVVGSLPATANQVTFFVKYIKSSTDGTVRTFDDSEVITVLDSAGSATAITATLISAESTGVGSAVSIKSGILYARGKFLIFDQQTLILDAYTNTPTYRVGFDILESIVDSDDDPSLVDNAAGFPNENAPGAHRRKIELTLAKLAPGSEGTDDFVELLDIENGEFKKNKTVRTEYSDLEVTFARRTYDESGDYTTTTPKIDIREFYDSGTNRGIYLPEKFEYTTQAEAKAISVSRFGVASPGSAHAVDSNWRPGSTSQDLINLMKAKLAVGVDPFKAYVRGYEIKTLAREYVDLDKARTFESSNNATIKTRVGNYVRVTNIYGLPDTKNLQKVTLYDRFTSTRGSAAASAVDIGTARVRLFEYESGTVGDVTAIYKMYLFDIQMKEGKDFFNTKQFFVSGFSADILPTYAKLDGTISIADNATAVAGQGTIWATGTGQELIAGDYIAYKDDTNVLRHSRVNATPTSNIALAITTAVTEPVTNQVFYYVFATLFDPQEAILVFPLPQNFVKTVTSDGSTVDTNYNVARYFAPQTVNGTGQIQILTDHADEVFPDYSSSDYIIVYTAGTNAGDVVNPDPSDIVPNGTNTQITIENLEVGDSVAVIATVRKVQGTPSTAKSKSLVTNSTKTVTTDAGLNEISLGVADILRIVSIYMSPDFSTAATTSHQNITSWYDLDNGQRDEFYDIGRIIRKPGFPKPTGRLLITFDYFTHGVNGNYFSVDTYTVINGLEYETIPSYFSKGLGFTYNLRDCLDFRPRVQDDGTGYTQISGGSLSEVPKDGRVFADFQYYLNRVDKLYLSQTGQLHIIKGITGVNPPPPEDPSDGMVTHELRVQAYTLSPDRVFADFRENKRYTMRDIGKIEKRVENLEYYTSLSLLEKDTESLFIPDAENPGLNRFKNGFIVDAFRGHGIGDTNSDDYKCAIDIPNSELRPMYWSDHVNIIEQSTTTEQRVIDHYTITGDLVTLPYEEVVLIDQPVASNTINVNPFSVVMFVGDILLNPPNDEWKDTERAPDLVVNHEGNFDSISQVVNGVGTIWNEWQEMWSGVPVTTQEKTIIGSEVSEVSMVHVDPENLSRLARGKKAWMSRPGIDPWPHRDIINTRTITTVDSKQSRTGIKGTVVPKVVTEDLGDKVVNVAYIPYIRTRDVEFRATGMMPNTRLYPFFDGIDVSGYCSKWSSPTVPEAFDSGDLVSTGTPLITDATGKVSGTFRIPNSDSVRFQTGERVFKLSSNSDGADADADSFGTAFYRAQGLLETKQKTILSTRNADVAWESVVESRVITDTTISDQVEKGPWIDPIAETFLVEDKGGCFLTSVELYFSAKDNDIPVTVEIRETVNGYPGSNVLPFSRVVKDAANVNISSDASSSTKFTFRDPVYVRQGGEYCIVCLTNSNRYKVWIATMGEDKVGTEIPILDQPYPGSFFKSQNASTWTADQYVDLKFKLNKAQFDISTIGTAVFVNDVLPTVTLDADPITTRNGESKIRIYHPNHGFRSDGSKNSRVTITGAATTNGISSGSINGTKTILSCDLDSYIIDTGSNATSTGRGGGSAMVASENRQMDVVQPVIQNMVLPDTDIKYSIKATSSKSVHPGSISDTLYVVDANYTPIIANANYEFTSPKMVASAGNETQHLSGGKSFFLKAQLSSSNPNLSPVIDTQRLAIITVGNRLDNPQPSGTDSINDSDVDANTVLAASNNVVFAVTGSKITSTNATVANALSQLQVGKFITVSGTTNNNGTYEVLSAVYTPTDSTKITIVVDATLVNESPASTTIVQLEKFISETAPSRGSVSSKYITKRMVLAQSSNGLRISFAAVKFPSNNIDVYYKISKVDDSTPFDELSWVLATVDGVSGESVNSRDFRDYSYTLNDLSDYNAVAVEIVMTGSNTCEVPKCKDLRMIALGT